jgi:molybdate transport system substrate-binding protein
MAGYQSVFKSIGLIASIAMLLQGSLVQAEQLTVAVAANVKYAFDELAQEFRKETGIEARSVIGSSGKLTAQITSGAPYDVMLSADMEYPQALYGDKMAVTVPKAYANGVLVLWTQNRLDLGKGIQVLSDPSVRKIAIANPRLAPYGREALHALEYFGLRAAVEPRLVYGESIAQVNQYIDSKAADIGFTAKSVVLAPEMQGRGKWIEVPRGSYQPIAQGVVILQHGAETQAESSRKFVAFLFSPQARAIFEKYGYVMP